MEQYIIYSNTLIYYSNMLIRMLWYLIVIWQMVNSN